MSWIGGSTTSIGASIGSTNRVPLMRQLSFVDRDMFMRYHWGLGIGHSYTHSRKVDTTANVGDFDAEEEEVNSDQDCGTISNSDREASDSDSESDSDASDRGQCINYDCGEYGTLDYEN